jgi:hypothetical protein
VFSFLKGVLELLDSGVSDLYWHSVVGVLKGTCQQSAAIINGTFLVRL